jgi:PAT family beta-lactamase induction signal transducer AmpG
LYFTEGIPFVVVMTVSVIMYKRLGISNADIAFYTSWLYLPWVIKPLWSPLVDLLRTKRFWIIAMQLLIGAGLGGVALTLPGDNFFRVSLAIFWLVAFSSATHDIAADGFYMLGLSQHEQTWFVGVRSTFYRLAMIVGQGILIMVAGALEEFYGGGEAENIPVHLLQQAWAVTFYILGFLFVILVIYHWLVLPRTEPAPETKQLSIKQLSHEFVLTFVTFFKKKHSVSILAFLLLYRFAEAQLAKIAAPFLLDTKATGGLALSTGEVGFTYGTVGIVMLTLGGLLGGFLAAKHGLKYWLWWMVAAINLPNAVYIFLAFVLPESRLLINVAVGVEQFGYGFGFTAYMLYMIYAADGEHKTAHFAICTGFMALGMMLPGMFSGQLQEYLGYQNFFLWVLVATIPSFYVASKIQLDENFGKEVES